MVRLLWLTCAVGCLSKEMELAGPADMVEVGGNWALTCILPWAKASAIIWLQRSSGRWSYHLGSLRCLRCLHCRLQLQLGLYLLHPRLHLRLLDHHWSTDKFQ